MASKKSSSSTDEFGNKMPASKPKPKVTPSSLRSKGIEKGNTAGARGSKTMTTARSSGAESKRSSKMDTQPSSARAAGAKAKAAAKKTVVGSARAAGAERMGITGKRSGSSLRARGIETGGVKKAQPSSYPQSVRAAGAKAKANDTQPSSFRAQRFGKGKVGASAPAGRNKTQSIRAAEYKKKNPGKY